MYDLSLWGIAIRHCIYVRALRSGKLVKIYTKKTMIPIHQTKFNTQASTRLHIVVYNKRKLKMVLIKD